MKKIFLFTLFIIIIISCKENDRMVYTSEHMIYFPSIKDKMDSTIVSLRNKDRETVYKIPVKVIGSHLEKDKNYKVEVIKEKTTAIEGKHFKAFNPIFTFNKNQIIDSVAIILYNDDIELATDNVILALRLVETDDIKLAYEDRLNIRIIFSTMLRRPIGAGFGGDLSSFQGIFGVYSVVKHELLNEIMGHDIYDNERLPNGVSDKNTIFNNEEYFYKFARSLYIYIQNNEVYDEKGNRILPW